MTTNSTILTRDIISQDIVLYQHTPDYSECKFTRDQFLNMVDYWKVLLVEKYQAGPGKKIIVDSRYLYYFSAVFAVWELGMTLIVDWNHARDEQDLDSKEYSMHKDIDYIICHDPYIDPTSPGYHHWDLKRNQRYCKQIISDKEFDTYQVVNPDNYYSTARAIFATPDTIAIQTATSGSTGMPSLKQISHKHVYLQARRLADLLNFSETDKTLHSVSLHHGASACYHCLPSFMKAKEHYILWTNIDIPEELHFRSNYIDKYKINKIFLYTTQQLLTFLKDIPQVNHTVDITTLFRITDTVSSLAQEKNISKIYSTFGDTSIGYGFLIKIWSKLDNLLQHDVKCMGPKRDDFFDLKVENGHLYVKSLDIDLPEWRTSHDEFEYKDNNYYFHGRGHTYRFGDEWVNHGELESKLIEFFPEKDGIETATIVMDHEQQEIYLAIWRPDPAAEEKFLQWISRRYQQLHISKLGRNLIAQNFMGSRKISRQKLREHFRKQSQL